jgi:hypothetical protein
MVFQRRAPDSEQVFKIKGVTPGFAVKSVADVPTK